MTFGQMLRPIGTPLFGRKNYWVVEKCWNSGETKL